MNSETQFREAFEAYADELFRHALIRLSNRDRALDLTQESFLRTWEYLRAGHTVERFRPFLYRTLNNLIVDEYRKHKPQSLDAMLEKEETFDSVEGKLLGDETDLFEESAIRFDGARALRALSQLPELYRTVVVMRYVDGFSPSEIAHCLDETENVVSVRIHRGLRKIRDILSSIPDETRA